jgi:hypothetical protein
MRSSTRKAVGIRVPMVVLALTLTACTAASGAPAIAAPMGDHSADAAEAQRARAFQTADHSLDQIETLKGGAFSH